MTRGSTLIEVMVTLFVLTAGLLVLFGMFPQGFNILSNSRNIGYAGGLLKNRAVTLSMRQDNMPIAIVPCDDNGNINNLINDNPNDGKDDTFKKENGEYVVNNGSYVRGNLLNCRKVVGESCYIPTADYYTTANGKFYGGKYSLMFGPIDTTRNSSNKKLKRFVVYGPEMINVTDSINVGNPLSNLWDDSAYVSYWSPEGDGNLYLAFTPYYAFTRDVNTIMDYDRIYKISYLVRHETTQQTFRKEGYIKVPGNYDGKWDYNFPNFSMDDYDEVGGELLTHVGSGYIMLPDTLEVHRVFEEVKPDEEFGYDPYQYIMADPVVGTVMFNPLGNDVVLDADGEKEPLKAYIDYMIYDPRIIVKDIQFPSHASFDGSVKINLGLGSILCAGLPDVTDDGSQTENPDEPTFEGLVRGTVDPTNNSVDLCVGKKVTDAEEIVIKQSILIIDVNTGLRVFPVNNGSDTEEGDILIDYDNGIVSFNRETVYLCDWKGEFLQDNSGNRQAVNLTNRTLRFYFRTDNDWNVRLCKLPTTFVNSTYEEEFKPTDRLAWNEFGFEKDSDRIYFPQAYAGGNAVVDYTDEDGNNHYGQLINISDYPQEDDEMSCYADLGRNYKEIISVHGASVLMSAHWRYGDSFRTRQMLLNVYGK